MRTNGGVPATICVLNGVAHVGLDAEQLIRLTASAQKGNVRKVSRRDVAFICGSVRLNVDFAYFHCLTLTCKSSYGQKFNGGTTISGTALLAELVGIRVFATGGLGGVHRNWENTMDVSADLTEMGKTRIVVVSSGCKGFLDIPRTLEYLETQGVGVMTFADGRQGDVDFPAFWTRDSGVKSPFRLEDERHAAHIACEYQKEFKPTILC